MLAFSAEPSTFDMIALRQSDLSGVLLARHDPKGYGIEPADAAAAAAVQSYAAAKASGALALMA